MARYHIKEIHRQPMADDEWSQFVLRAMYTPEQLQGRSFERLARCFTFFAARSHTDELVGAVALAHTDRAEETELSYLVTDKAHRRQGVGKLLFDTAINAAKELGYAKCTIGARQEAMSFYDQFPVIHTEHFYTSNTGPHEWLEVDLLAL